MRMVRPPSFVISTSSDSGRSTKGFVSLFISSSVPFVVWFLPSSVSSVSMFGGTGGCLKRGKLLALCNESSLMSMILLDLVYNRQ